MDGRRFSIKQKVWLYQGPAAWHFVTIGRESSSEIKRFEPFPRRGFGAIRVRVTVGETTWDTSVFWEKKGTYILPIKKSVREAERIKEEDIVKIDLEIINR